MSNSPIESTQPAAAPPAPGWRRLAAFAVDYMVIAAWLTVLTAGGFAARNIGLSAGPFPESAMGRLALHALFFILLTLPVLLYFALSEASHRQATLGKRALGLRVVDAATGSRLSVGRSLLRTAVKFVIPWEIAHLGVWHVPGRPFVDEPGMFSYACWFIGLTIGFFWVVTLFLPGCRAPYDRLAGAAVRSRRVR